MELQAEERIECVASGKVRYSRREDRMLVLPVAIEATTNKSEKQLLNFDL